MSERDEADVVRLDRVRDKVKHKQQDARADAMAAQFHTAMGWKGKPDKPGGKKKAKRKKR